MVSSYICLACLTRIGQCPPSRIIQWQTRSTFISLSRNPRSTADGKARERSPWVTDTAKTHTLDPQPKTRVHVRKSDPENRLSCRPAERHNLESTQLGTYHKIELPVHNNTISPPLEMHFNTNTGVQKQVDRCTDNATGDELDRLFQKSLAGLHSTSPFPSSTSSNPSVLKQYMNGVTLKKMLGDACPLSETWPYFIRSFPPRASWKSFPHFLKKSFKQLWKEMLKAKQKNPYDPTLPSAAEVLGTYYQHGALSSQRWTEMMILLLEEQIKHIGKPYRESSKQGFLISDILRSWNIVCRSPELNKIFEPESSLDWSQVPVLDVSFTGELFEKNGLSVLSGLAIPLFRSADRDFTTVSLVIISTFGVLVNSSVNVSTQVKDAKPLIKLLAAVVGVPGLDIRQFSLKNHNAPLKIYLLQSWVEIREAAHRILNSDGKGQEMRLLEAGTPHVDQRPLDGEGTLWAGMEKLLEPQHNTGRDCVIGKNETSPEKKECFFEHRDELVIENWLGENERSLNNGEAAAEHDCTAEARTKNFVSHMTGSPVHSRIRSAMKLKNHQKLDDIWAEVATWPATLRNERSHDGLLSRELCNLMISAYMHLQRAENAIDVWNHMIQVGITPSVKSWNSMMSGCKAKENWRGLEQIWNNMKISGVQPDAISWTTRISTLMASDKIEKGIQALDEMGRLWLAAAEKQYPDKNVEELRLVEDVDGAAKPVAHSMNAAIYGLLAAGKRTAANHVVSWAANFGVKPDVVTYNTFLRPLVRHGRQDEVQKLLKRMEEAGVAADVATFTTILEQPLRDSDQLMPGQRKAIIDSLLSQMDSVGVSPNSMTYGKIIFRLARDFDRANEPIINSVLEHMASRGLQPSVYVLTNLLEYYFRQNPPNLEAARRTIERVASMVGQDRKFWDTVVECYANIGHTATALHILGRLSSEKTRVGWAALRALLEALVAKDEWDLAKSFVRDVMRDTSGYRKGTRGELMFWELVEKLGLG